MGVLEGKAVIVTGAGQGLGRAYALDAAREGASVVVNDVDAASAKEVVAEIDAGGGRAVVSVGSVADWEAAKAIVDTCVAEFGSLDGLVNNAGIVAEATPWEMNEADIRALVEVNLMGAIFVGTHASRVMVEQGSGSIVNATSSAQFGLPMQGAYGSTKGALASLTYSWSMDLADKNVRVNAISPMADTAMARNSAMLAKALAAAAVTYDIPSAEDNACIVTYLLSDLSQGITGQVVQRRTTYVAVVAHPRITDHTATCETWNAESLAASFDPVLRANLESVGWSVSKS